IYEHCSDLYLNTDQQILKYKNRNIPEIPPFYEDSEWYPIFGSYTPNIARRGLLELGWNAQDIRIFIRKSKQTIRKFSKAAPRYDWIDRVICQQFFTAIRFAQYPETLGSSLLPMTPGLMEQRHMDDYLEIIKDIHLCRACSNGIALTADHNVDCPGIEDPPIMMEMIQSHHRLQPYVEMPPLKALAPKRKALIALEDVEATSRTFSMHAAGLFLMRENVDELIMRPILEKRKFFKINQGKVVLLDKDDQPIISPVADLSA